VSITTRASSCRQASPVSKPVMLDSACSSGDEMRIAVLGAGSWGTALAAHCAKRHPTLLWAREPKAAEQLTRLRENIAHLPGVRLPQTLAYTAELGAVWRHLGQGKQALIILGVPVAGLADVCHRVHEGLTGGQTAAVVWTCKGFVADSACLPHEVVEDIFADAPHLHTGVLSGPSFAREVAQGLPVALTVASASPAVCQRVTQAVHGNNARIYTSTDVVGVEVGGALKNIIAVACGICDGLQLGTNARAALITRGVAEMSRLGVALGAQARTIDGLSGLGDLVLTATGDLSRNRRVGLELGRGRSLAAILADGITAEGVYCAQAALVRGRALGVSLPIIEAVCDVLFNDKSPAETVIDLLAREARAEHPEDDARPAGRFS